jgi:hypothetical protein
MAINFNNRNQGIGALNLGDFGLQQPEENMTVAEVFNTPESLMEIGAVEPGTMYGYNLTDPGEALEDFRNSAVNFRNAPANSANTVQSAYDFIMNTNPTMYKDIKQNKDFIQDAINKGFLETEQDYEKQKSFADPDDLQAMAISNYDQLFGPRTMTDANQGLYTGMMNAKSGTPIDYTDRIMNSNLPGFAVQPSKFQNFRNQISGLKDFLPFGPKSLTGMAARGLGSMLSDIAPRTYGYSQRTYDAMTPSQQEFVDDLYNPDGLLEGYNKISAFGRGPLGTLSNRLGTIQNTLARQKVKSKVLQQREKEISNAINESINRGEREALSDRNRSVDYGVTGGPTRTDIDVADGGAESGGRGKIVCTMMNDSYGFGNFRNKIWLKHSRDLPKEYEVGYHTIFLPLVKFAKGKGRLNKTVKKTLEHIARHRTYDLKQEMKGKTHLLGRAYRKVLEPLCFIIGKIKSALGRG